MFNTLAQYIMVEDEIFFTLYLWALVIDVFTGVACAIRLKRLYSKVGLNGMIRHIIIFMLVMVSTTILYTLGYTTIAHAIQFYIFVFYAISVIENIDIVGGNFLPDWVEDFFMVLKDKQDDLLKTIITTKTTEVMSNKQVSLHQDDEIEG